MNLFEFASLMNRDLEFTVHATVPLTNDSKMRFFCEFELSFIKSKSGSTLTLTFISGDGNSFNEAMNDYVKKIRGKTLAFLRTDSLPSQEVKVPKNLKLFPVK